MPKTEVILTHNIVGLGAESDQVKVAAGYARNYLFPQRLAIPLTMANKRQIESLRQRRAEREAHEFNTMTELAKGVAKLICIIKVKAGEDGKMFGAVTAGVIADELKHQFDITLDKRKIYLEHPIRALGDHEVELHLHAEVKGTLKVRVESLTPVVAPVPAEPKKEEGREPRREKRSYGRRDAEGEKAEKPEAAEVKPKGEKHGEKHAKAEKTEAAEAKPKSEKHAEKHAKAEKPEAAETKPKGEKHLKAEKAEKAPKAEKKEKKAE
jgi:large subunit ribosomal protein L9